MRKFNSFKNFIIRNKILPIIVVALISASLVYLLKPTKKSTQIYPWDLKDGTQFACSPTLGTTLFPEPDYGDNTFKKVEGELFTNDKTKMAIEIDGKTLKMITAQGVELGLNKPA